MEKNSILSGFIVLDQQRVDELEADLWQMEHQKSGARLVWLERAEENKTFGIAFQTQPWDDTGVFHILEHSVLCGSKRYPVKEPFVELMKSSMNTFLNAMTFPDRTVYPVSSRNGQDFINTPSRISSAWRAGTTSWAKTARSPSRAWCITR